MKKLYRVIQEKDNVPFTVIAKDFPDDREIEHHLEFNNEKDAIQRAIAINKEILQTLYKGKKVFAHNKDHNKWVIKQIDLIEQQIKTLTGV